MLRKIGKWTGLVLLLLIAGVAIATATRQHLTYQAPYPSIKASADTAVIAKGRHLALVTKGCVHCHSPVANVDSVLKLGQDPPLTGTKKLETPFGDFYAPNLTPHASGIAGMTDGELARVLRYGVKKNGEAVLPFMQGLDMSDADMTALISYLRSLTPQNSTAPAHEFNLLGRFAKAFMVQPTLPAAVAQ